MRSNKLLIILSSLIILMMCLSVVSAAIENVDDTTKLDNKDKVIDNVNNKNIDDTDGIDEVPISDKDSSNKNNEITQVANDNNEIIKTKIEIDGPWFDTTLFTLKEVKSEKTISGAKIKLVVKKGSEIVHEETSTTSKNGDVSYDSSKLSPGTYTITATYEGNSTYESSTNSVKFNQLIPTSIQSDVEPFNQKAIYPRLTDENGNPLVKKTLNFRLYTLKGEYLSETKLTTDSEGMGTFDTSKLKAGTYKVIVEFAGDSKYDTSFEEFKYTAVKDKPNPHNDTNKTKPIKKDKKPIDMNNTGLPIIALIVGLMVTVGIGYRKY